MGASYIIPEFEIERNEKRCTMCGSCVTQCSNGVHSLDKENKVMLADESKCVNCQRCVSFCPAHAIKIVKNECTYRENANWKAGVIQEIYKQASSGGVLLSSMGNPNPVPVYWDRILINASQVTNPSIGHLPGAKIVGDVSRTRMIPEGSDAISPAPHHDIYSIEDLRQLVYSLKEATEYKKPVIVKVAAVHNIAAIASGIARSGADIIAIDGFRGGTGAAPTRIRDNVGIPIELALAAVDTRLREEGIRNNVSIIAGGSIRSSADIVKAVALGADACYVATAALLALGCHLCRTCQSGKCSWGIATQRPELVKRLDPEWGAERLQNLMTAWKHEIKELMGGMGINSIEALRGNRLMLRGVGMTEKELEILGIAHAGE